MSDPCSRQILNALVSQLGSAVAHVPGLVVELNRDPAQPVSDADLPRLVVFAADLTPDVVFTGEDAYAQAVEIHGFASGETADAADQTGQQLRGRALQALLADPTLGGLARNLVPSPEPPPDRLGIDCTIPAYVFALTVEVEFATVEGDPFTFA